MGFRVFLHPKAKRFVEKRDKTTKEILKNKLAELEKSPREGKHLKHSKFWSLRIGDYRAIYEIDKKSKRVIVLFVGHRKNVYDDFSKLI